MAKTNQKFTENDFRALELIQQYPTENNSQISKRMEAEGYTKGHNYLSNRMTKNDALLEQSSKVRERNEAKFQRDIVPKAMVRLEKGLDNDDLDEKAQFKYVSLAVKTGLQERSYATSPSPVPINIDTIQVYINQRSAQQDDSNKSIVIDSQERVIDDNKEGLTEGELD